jgi:hypothetical protein
MNKYLVAPWLAVLLAVFVGLSGCVISIQDIILDDVYYQNASRDPFVFNSVKLRMNILLLNVSYGGGCEEHEFALIGTSFMESNPVQVNVLLSHEDHDDPCDMWITQSMVFNLLPLKKAWQQQYNEVSGKIVINLQGWEDSIIYEF